MLDNFYGPVLAPKICRLGTYAAALAYCFVLSLVPFLVVTFTLGTMITHENLATAYADLLVDILPSEANQPTEHHHLESVTPSQEAEREKVVQVAGLTAKIVHTLQSSSHGGLATVGFLLAVWTSFNLMTQIVRTLTFIFDDAKSHQSFSPTMIMKTIALFSVWMVLMLFFAICSVVTPVIRSVLQSLHLNPILWTDPLLWARDLLGLASLFGAFFLTYYLVPSKRYKLAQVRDGSLVASIGWVLVSLFFAKVIPNIWRANAVYQALGSIVVILIWAQACAWMVIIGACWIVRAPGRRGGKKLKAEPASA